MIKTIVLPSFLLASCALFDRLPGTQKKSASNMRKIKGDPYAFVKNTAMNGNPGLPDDLLMNGSAWDVSATGWIESLAQNATMSEATKSQDPNEMNTDELSSRMIVIKDAGTLNLSGQFNGRTLTLVLRAMDNSWRLSSVSFGNETRLLTEQFRLIHTSASDQHEGFSLLFHSTKPTERSINAFYFVREKPRFQAHVDSAYEYLFGPGVQVGWNKKSPVRLRTCHAPTAGHARLVQDAVKKWRQALDSRLDFRVADQGHCPPFSDLNTQTFNYMTDWIEFEGELGQMGATTTVAGPGQQEIIDSDCFILLGEYQENMDIAGVKANASDASILGNADYNVALARTILHEIGHFLGLHHQFKNIKSIMSYEADKENRLEDYDVRAIRALYADPVK